jgi:hypothetical protein
LRGFRVPGKFDSPSVAIPALIEQNDTPSWTDEPFADTEGNVYGPAAYQLTYRITGPTSPVTVQAVAQGAGWLTSLTAAQTAAFTPGMYWWQARISGAGIAYTVARGELVVVADLALAGAGYDGRSANERALAAVEAALAALTGSGGARPLKQYRIGEREFTYLDIPALHAEHARLLRAVTNERAANSIAQGQGNPRKLYTRFPAKFGVRS